MPTKDGSCGLIRVGAVNFLSSRFNVTVVTIDYEGDKVNKAKNIIRIPINKKELKVGRWLEKLGVFEDYLDIWVKRCVSYLENIIDADTIIFATCGGDLASIEIGALLKKKTGCKLVINFHDPVLYSMIDDERFGVGFHFSREKIVDKYIKSADLIITSSLTYQEILNKKYCFVREKTINNYFGYVEMINESFPGNLGTMPYTIVYAGSMTDFQKPEIMYEYLCTLENLEYIYIGDCKTREKIYKLKKHASVHLIEKVPHSEFINYMISNATLSFVSLYGNNMKACVPSKIFEYINLELPIVAALPEGDAMNLINDGGYGIACKYNDQKAIKKAVQSLLIPDRYLAVKSKMHRDKEMWSMKNRIQEIFPYLENL